MNSSENEKSPEQTCCWVYKQGRLAGTRCTNFVTKRDPQKSMCCQHYYRQRSTSPTNETGDKESISIDSLKAIGDLQKEARFEERFVAEQELYKEESEYRMWKIKRLGRGAMESISKSLVH